MYVCWWLVCPCVSTSHTLFLSPFSSLMAFLVQSVLECAVSPRSKGFVLTNFVIPSSMILRHFFTIPRSVHKVENGVLKASGSNEGNFHSHKVPLRPLCSLPLFWHCIDFERSFV
uniref:Putative secreted protein n=1 Tax=Anopheles darlingi TaxID=43151 RepID=A0A2M4D941_ANODA